MSEEFEPEPEPDYDQGIASSQEDEKLNLKDSEFI